MNKYRHFAFLKFALISFAGNSLLCRLALRSGEIDPATFTSIRLLSGALVLIGIVYFKSKKLNLGGNWSSALSLFIYAAGFSWAYVNLSAATGALLLFGAVQATMIIAGQINGERMKIKNWLGCFIAVLGLIIFLLPGLSTPSFSSATIMMIAGLAWGIYSLKGRGSGDPTLNTAGNFIRCLPFAALLVIVYSSQLQASSKGIMLALTSGVVTSGLGYVIWYSVLPKLTATRAAVVQLSVPIITALGGGLFLGEAITLRILISAVTVLAGIALVILK